jgi:hypothetical protein
MVIHRYCNVPLHLLRYVTLCNVTLHYVMLYNSLIILRIFVLWTADDNRVINCEIWKGLTHDGASCVIVHVRVFVCVCVGGCVWNAKRGYTIIAKHACMNAAVRLAGFFPSTK